MATVEELQAELKELKSGNDALAAKNKELLDEVKAERRKKNEASTDMTKLYELQDKHDALKDEKTKLEHDLKKSIKTVEKLTVEKESLTTDLTKLIRDDGLTKQLVEIGVRPEFLEASAALLRDKVSIVDNKAVVGDKPLEEFMEEWSTADGKVFVAAPANGGGGGQGGQGGADGQAPEKGTREYDIYRAEQLLNEG